ncbi:DUF1905 domain-containing protein [Sphingomicrobium aestuariivivum]|uniref:DUF1905 domain-containing protein n=1 Tax=Sphingomicrobium aestuariivivum TaxID=1582356 RepID=UPI001FD6F047|nr:DUF1905 domain-containing protein [Sphingomicrobium aestuariivivum]MCJ8189861.1 DUF1905 domain-containing protein [Sphingomicrobium aestuariivivum]
MIGFEARVHRWSGGNWYFVTLPEEAAAEARFEAEGRRGGFGSIKVAVRLGASVWRTSLFPDRQSGSFLLPLKKAVRDAEGLGEGSVVAISLEVCG